jgi:hypothetical protein
VIVLHSRMANSGPPLPLWMYSSECDRPSCPPQDPGPLLASLGPRSGQDTHISQHQAALSICDGPVFGGHIGGSANTTVSTSSDRNGCFLVRNFQLLCNDFPLFLKNNLLRNSIFIY